MVQPVSHITLITTNAIGFPPFIFHRAIRFRAADGKTYVLHQTTTGVEILSYEKFMNGRTIYAEKSYPVRYGFDPERIKQEDKKEFDWMGNNCEDFTSEVIESASGKQMRPKSPQRAFWILILAVILVALIYTHKKK